MTTYPLENILLSFADKRGNRRTLYNLGALGGINTNLVKIFLLSLPFIEYAIIFNPIVFNALGIATAIVFFIVFLSIVMLIVFFVFYIIKKNVIKKITPSWNKYFPEQDLAMVLSVGISPYSDFFKHYSAILKENLSLEEMHKRLNKAFVEMEKDNKDLLDAIKRNTNPGN